MQCYYNISKNLFDEKTEIGPGIEWYLHLYNSNVFVQLDNIFGITNWYIHLCRRHCVNPWSTWWTWRRISMLPVSSYKTCWKHHCYNLLCTTRPKWVKAEGITYQKPCALLVGVENDCPLFGSLEDIFIVNSRILLYVTSLETLCFNEHLQAYVISYMSNTSLIQLNSHIPTYIHRVVSQENDSLNVIVCKHHVCGTLDNWESDFHITLVVNLYCNYTLLHKHFKIKLDFKFLYYPCACNCNIMVCIVIKILHVYICAICAN